MPSLRFRTRPSLLLTALCACGGAAHATQTPPERPVTTTPAPAAATPPATARKAPATGTKSPAAAKKTRTLAHAGSYTFDAASSDVDYKTHSGSFKQITISQGKITVRADQAHATGLGRTSGQWTLKGHVRIHAPPHGSLNADRAVVEVSSSHITQVTVSGNPAQFTQQGMMSGKTARGHADQIVYDVGTGTVQLSQDAWLSDGRNQISGPLVRYNILKDRIEATSGGAGERVHITIAPQTPHTKRKRPPAKPHHPSGRPS